MKLRADIHEPQTMIDYLRNLGWEVSVEHLKVADYVRGNAAFERKTINDAVNSIRNNRFWHQLSELKQYPIRYVGISGKISEIRRWQDVKPFLGAMARISRMNEGKHGFGISCLRADNDRELAYIIHCLFKDVDETKRLQEIVKRRRGRTIQETREDMLSSIDGMGLKSSQKLLQNKSIEYVLDLRKEKIIEILGKSKGEKVYGVLFG